MSWMNNGNNFGSTGYMANRSINLEEIVSDIIKNSLNGARQSYPPEVIQEAYNRLMNNLNPLCDFLQRTYASPNNQIDSVQIANHLTNNEIPNVTNQVMNEFRNMTMNNGYMNNGFNNGYGNGYNNMPNYNNYNNGFNQSRTNTMFWNNTPHVNTANAASQYGISRVWNEKEIRNTNSNVFSNNSNMNYNTNNIQQPTHIERKSDDTLFKHFSDYISRRKFKISIDKLTEDSSELVHNKEYMKNHLVDPSIPVVSIIGNNGTQLDPRNVTAIETATPESPEYCTVVSTQDISERGNLINTSNYDLLVPVVSAKEAIELVKEAVPNLTGQDHWISTISYKELIAKKIPGYGLEAKAAFRSILQNLPKLKCINDISNIIIPILNKQHQAVKEYIEELIFDRVNKLFKMSLYEPEKPTNAPIVHAWSHIYQLVDRHSTDIPYIRNMFDKFGESYIDAVFICVKSALNDIFNSDGSDTVIDADPEIPDNLGLIAKLNSVTTVIGKFRMADYGYMPENYKKELFHKFDHDYIVHKYNQDMIVTNIDVTSLIGSNSKFTIVDGFTNISQYVIDGIMRVLKENNQLVNLPLIQLDTTGEYIVGTFTISLGLDNSILITKV